MKIKTKILASILILAGSFSVSAQGDNYNLADGFTELAKKVVQVRSDGKKASYAFVALTTEDGNANVEDHVTDSLTEAVFKTGKVRVFERANLERILSEQKFQSSGLVDENTAKDIGKLAGVDYICYGSIKNVVDSLIVNVRVVNVQDGEICAMSRTTVAKDRYLKDVKFAARKNSVVNTAKKDSGTTTGSGSAVDIEAARKRAANTAWKVKKVRNDFDGETIYTITCNNPDGTALFFGYEKCDRKINSRVRCSMKWGGYNAEYWSEFDFKMESGDIIKLTPRSEWKPSAEWDYAGGWNYEKRSDSYMYIWSSGVAASKKFLDMFLNNNVIYIRDRSNVHPYETAGFLDVLIANGITLEEINAAFANETF
ncbi:MAG: hypothetical protein KBT11_00465 [Treponema sp.]|nr:hypothetical protein [Candidatus Treponema equifaecale]